MRNVLFVCATHEQAKQKFNHMVKVLGAGLTASVSYSNLKIVFEEVTYSFVSISQDLEVRLKGNSFHSIIVDEWAKSNLTEAQDTYLKIIERP